MPMYNLIEYCSSYSGTTGSLQFYSKDETTKFDTVIANTNNFKSLMHQTILPENTVGQAAPNEANGILRNAAIAVPLKCLSNFWRSLEMSLANCKVELKLACTNYCVLSAAGNHNDNDRDDNITINTEDTNYMFLS